LFVFKQVLVEELLEWFEFRSSQDKCERLGYQIFRPKSFNFIEE